MNETSEKHPIQYATERLFVEFFHRLKPLLQERKVDLTQAIRAAKDITHDDAFMTQLMEELCHRCNPCEDLDGGIYHYQNVYHFRRLVIHYLTLVSDHQHFENPISNYWLLHWLDIVEIALGKVCFEEAHAVCLALIERLKEAQDFHYAHFLEHPEAMLEYAVLMTNLAAFIESNPKHRIEWLVNAMESNPNTHIVNGLAVHIEDKSPPSHAQIKQLVIAVFEHTCHYIKTHDLDASIGKRLGKFNQKPSELLAQLHRDLVLFP